ncbi:Y1114 [Hepatospora eriocheir]|uniref:Y1114 n=1 Tax=Hepatospora eriocheir TaxID=1081669 RepID=A0A1X0QDD5_9MICR|nr:Y1114 [Hepatospora eriocheir]
MTDVINNLKNVQTNFRNVQNNLKSVKDELNKKTDKFLKTLKPKLRGYFHAIGFFTTLVILIPFIVCFFYWKFDLNILLYFAVQLTTFGISATYHIYKFSETSKKIMQRLDHMSIFLLISGTQTAVLNNTPKKFDVDIKWSIWLSWLVAFIGIVRKACIHECFSFTDVAIYIVHGCLVSFSFKTLMAFYLFDLIFVILGGVFYILGGFIIGFEWPDPKPEIYGFHELFHTLTLLGNSCFSIVVFKSYFYRSV